MAFLDALRRAARAQLQQGREVVIAGDLNLCHRHVDAFWKDRILNLRRLFREPRGEDENGDDWAEGGVGDGEGYPLPELLQQRCAAAAASRPTCLRCAPRVSRSAFRPAASAACVLWSFSSLSEIGLGFIVAALWRLRRRLVETRPLFRQALASVEFLFVPGKDKKAAGGGGGFGRASDSYRCGFSRASALLLLPRRLDVTTPHPVRMDRSVPLACCMSDRRSSRTVLPPAGPWRPCLAKGRRLRRSGLAPQSSQRA